MEQRDWKPFAALLFVQFSFASLAVVGKVAVEALPPIVVAGLRMFFASLFLAAAGIAARDRPTGPDLLKILGLSLLGIVFNQLLFLEGLERTTAVNASILVATIPIFTTALAVAFRREALNATRLTGIGVALAGALVLLGVESFDVRSSTQVGNLMIVLNSLSYSFYLVLSRPLLHKYRSITVVAWTFLFGSVLIAPLAAFRSVTVDFGAVPSLVWWAMAWIIVVPSVLSYSLNNYALKRVRSSTVATYVFLQPLIGVALALALLPEETLPLRSLLGGLLILGGVIVVSRTERAEPVVAIPESGEAMSRDPIESRDAGAQPEPQEDDRRGRRQDAP